MPRSIDSPGTVTCMFLGKEAGFNNFFFDVGGVPVDTITEASGNVGVTSTQTHLAGGVLSFSSGTYTRPGGGVANGFATNSSATLVIFGG